MNDRRSSLVICGLGGQGVLFLTKLLGEAALLEGRPVLTCETHGMAQRGGAVYSHVKIGDFDSPQVRRGRADAAIALDASRRGAAQIFAGPAGKLFVNGPANPADPAVCDAAGVAAAMGFPRGLNLVLLGFASKRAPHLFPAPDALVEAIRRLSSPETFERNRQAFLTGAARA